MSLSRSSHVDPFILHPGANIGDAKHGKLPTHNRNALGTVDRNAPTSRIISKAIPQPATHPDVFAATPPIVKSRISDALQRKRPLDAEAAPLKRPRIEGAKKPIDEKWISRWLKMFPTLVIHFEHGAEDGAGRLLKQRATKLGATIDPFFSHTVTHLIVKTVASPQKGLSLFPAKRVDEPSPLAAKAVDMGIKVWSLKKLGELISNISPVELAATDSLRTLLEDERLHGTRERDTSAPRPDHYYFRPGNKYALIEDATGRHRPIMVKEYPPTGKEGSDWPVLHETFLRISTPNVTDTPLDQLRARAWSLYVDHDNERPPGGRTYSLAGTPQLPQAQPYQIASGNSVVITSNIASTSNANPSPYTVSGPAMKQLSKRVQVLKGNARLAASRNQPNDLFAPSLRHASTGVPLQEKSFMTQDQVVKMLRQARQPVRGEEVTREMRIVNHERVYGLGEKQDAGYCENCRLRFADLSTHVASKKHRRFAHDSQNFIDLDRLLSSLRRPALYGSYEVDETEEE